MEKLLIASVTSISLISGAHSAECTTYMDAGMNFYLDKHSEETWTLNNVDCDVWTSPEDKKLVCIPSEQQPQLIVVIVETDQEHYLITEGYRFPLRPAECSE